MKQILLVVTVILLVVSSKAQQPYKRILKLMGSRFEITVIAVDSLQANHYFNEAINEIVRIEKLISSWDTTSQTSEINRKAGKKPVKIDKELFDLINRSISISKLTDGAFDISFASMDKVWSFDGSITEMPSPEQIERAVSKVNFNNIILDEQKTSVFLKQEGMKIGFGAIGKGYAADKAKSVLIEFGVEAGIINASGDMSVWGKQPNGEEWKVALTNPMDKNNAFALLPVSEGSVVTSGSYEKYLYFDGERYSHIIDPRTGYPSRGLVSVTVFAPKAELADALATAIFVMGDEVGINLINQISKVDCVIVKDDGTIVTSKNIKIKNL